MPVSEHPAPDEAMVEFLRENRRSSNQFLRGVHEWFLDEDNLTAAQQAAVGRIMREMGWFTDQRGRWMRPTPMDGDGNLATTEAPVVPEDLGVPADHNQATSIVSGEYTVSTAIATHQFRIFTIRQSRTAALVNKRIMSRYVDGDWQNFGYLTTTGHVKLWRRFEDQANEAWVLYARQLLTIMRERRVNFLLHSTTVHHNDDFGHWTVTIQRRTCRYCGRPLSTSMGLRHGHDNCARRQEFDPDYTAPPPLPDDDFDEREAVAHDRGPRARRYGPATRTEQSTLSQLGSGWEQ